MPSRRPMPGPSRRLPLAANFTYRIRVDLLDTDPAIWRLIEVPSTLTLDALHPILQTAMGWTDSHLHQFILGDPQVHWNVERYLTAFDIEEGDEGVAEAAVRLDEVLQDVGDELRYTYDFGDGWDHLLRLESRRPRTDQDPPAALHDGRRACPPEDCGGPYGYDELLSLLVRAVEGDRLDPDDAERVDWACGGDEPADVLADAERLDVAEIDADLRAGRFGGVLAADLGDLVLPTDVLPGDARAAVASSLSPELSDLVDRCDWRGRPRLLALIATARLDAPALVDTTTVTSMVEPFAWFVRHVGLDGHPLTAQGYLKPADVTAVAEHLHLDDEWIGTMNRESLTPAVAEFRKAAQRTGLLRVAKGRIHATARGAALTDDPVALWRHLAERLPAGRADHERDAGLLVLLSLAAGGAGDGDLGGLMSSLGWSFRESRPLGDDDVRHLAATTIEALVRLGCFNTTTRRHGYGPTATGQQFARAALRTQTDRNGSV